MATPFAWRDFGKKATDLHSKYIPKVNPKTKNLEDSVSFKVGSKAQKGVEFETKVVTKDQASTDAEFSAKVQLDKLPGVKLEFKGKNKPTAEFKVKANDKVIPVEGLEVGGKFFVSEKDAQTLGLFASYKNQYVNFNGSADFPAPQKLAALLNAPAEEGENNSQKQRVKLATDFVVKPLVEDNYYVGVNATAELKNEQGDDLYYQTKVAVGYQVDEFIAAAYYDQSQKAKKDEGVEVCKKTGVSVYSEVDDVALSGHLGYCLTKKQMELSAVAGIKRDANSKVSVKAKILPNPTVSLGYFQKLNDNMKMDFGYAFLLANSGEDKKKASAFSFGLEFSH